MAFGGGTNTGAANSSTANQTSATIVASGGAGELLVVVVAVDNNQTTDGDEGAVTSITDSVGGNTYTKAIEFTNGQGAAQAGATCSLWYSVLVNALTGSTITVNFSNSTSRDKSCIGTNSFTFGAGNTIAVEATNTLANDASDPGSLNATTANIECLRIRAIAGETNSTAELTETTNWTDWNLAGSGGQTSGGGSAANMAVRAEHRISTGTGDASNPTWVSADHASVYVAFKEVSTAAPSLLFNPMPLHRMLVR